MSATMVMSPKSSIGSPRRLQTAVGSISNATEAEYQRAVSNFLSAKDRPFAISGTIPISAEDPLVLFFRTSSGISHSLPFPLKTDSLQQLPALNVLLAACETSPDAPFDDPIPITENTEQELPLVWPSSLPYSTTFELSNHPVLDIVRSVLFPNSHPGTYLFAQRRQLEVILAGAHSEPRRPWSSRGGDGAKLVATIIVTFPVRYRGGTLVVSSPDGAQERFIPTTQQTLNANGDTQLHWTAFLANCEHEVDYVEQGCRIAMSYAVYMKTFGPAGSRPNPLLTPNDQLLDALSSVLNMSRGRRLGIYLTGKYDCSPPDVLADSLVPSLKGSDSMLYHALRLYKLTPELHWTTAGYVWPVDKTVQLSAYTDGDDLPVQSLSRLNLNYPYSAPNSPLSQNSRSLRQRPHSVLHSTEGYDRESTIDGIIATGRMSPRGRYSSRGTRSMISDLGEEADDDDLNDRIIEGGAVPLNETDIVLLTARDQSVSREKVPFISRGALEKLVVNILLVAYIQ